MASVFVRATKRRARARLAIDGPSGAGKTFNGLIFSRALAGPSGRIACVDTERGSASLYAPDFNFDVLDFPPPYHPARLVTVINMAVAEKYDVLFIDSLTHFWTGEGGTLDIVDSATVRGNTFGSGWKVGTPAQRHMMDTILGAPIHVVVTMRSKMEYVLEERDGKKVPRKVGLAPEQRAGVEYEFTMVADFDLEHRMSISKSRCTLLSDVVAPKERVGEWAHKFVDWLNDGADEEPSPMLEIVATPVSTPPLPTPPASIPAPATPTPSPVIPKPVPGMAPAPGPAPTARPAPSGVTPPPPAGQPAGRKLTPHTCPQCGVSGVTYLHRNPPDDDRVYYCAPVMTNSEGQKGCGNLYGDRALQEVASAAPAPASAVPDTIGEPAADSVESSGQGGNILHVASREERTRLAKMHNDLRVGLAPEEFKALCARGYEPAHAFLALLGTLTPALRPAGEEMRTLMAKPHDEAMAFLASLAQRATA